MSKEAERKPQKPWGEPDEGVLAFAPVWGRFLGQGMLLWFVSFLFPSRQSERVECETKILDEELGGLQIQGPFKSSLVTRAP